MIYLPEFAANYYDFCDPVQAAVVAEAAALHKSYQILLHLFSAPPELREAHPTYAMQAAVDAAMAGRYSAGPFREVDKHALEIAFERLNANVSVPARELYDLWGQNE